MRACFAWEGDGSGEPGLSTLSPLAAWVAKFEAIRLAVAVRVCLAQAVRPPIVGTFERLFERTAIVSARFAVDITVWNARPEHAETCGSDRYADHRHKTSARALRFGAHPFPIQLLSTSPGFCQEVLRADFSACVISFLCSAGSRVTF